MINFKDIVIDTIYDLDINLNKEEIKELIEIPPNPEMGDFSFPCFKLAKLYRKAPNLIAEDLVKQLPDTEEFESIKAISGYINFTINKKLLAKQVIETVLSEKENYGKSI